VPLHPAIGRPGHTPRDGPVQKVLLEPGGLEKSIAVWALANQSSLGPCMVARSFFLCRHPEDLGAITKWLAESSIFCDSIILVKYEFTESSTGRTPLAARQRPRP
jgi:hypothetical protein